MKTSYNQQPDIAVILTGIGRKRARLTRRQQKRDLLLTFMNQLQHHAEPPIRKKPAFLRSLLSIFL